MKGIDVVVLVLLLIMTSSIPTIADRLMDLEVQLNMRELRLEQLGKR